MIEKKPPWKWGDIGVVRAYRFRRVRTGRHSGRNRPPFSPSFRRRTYAAVCPGLRAGRNWRMIRDATSGCRKLSSPPRRCLGRAGVRRDLPKGKEQSQSHGITRRTARPRSVHEGELENGKRTGYWELRRPHLTKRGEYRRGSRIWGLGNKRSEWMARYNSLPDLGTYVEVTFPAWVSSGRQALKTPSGCRRRCGKASWIVWPVVAAGLRITEAAGIAGMGRRIDLPAGHVP